MPTVNVFGDGATEGFVTAASLMGVRVPAAAPAPTVGAPPPVSANGQPPAAINGAIAAAGNGAATSARPPMRWKNNTSGFVLRRISQLIQTCARADKDSRRMM
jgi:hypothetical protein